MAQPSSSSNKITMNEARELLRQHDASMPDYDRIWREIDQEERRVREELTNARPGDPILGRRSKAATYEKGTTNAVNCTACTISTVQGATKAAFNGEGITAIKFFEYSSSSCPTDTST
eukprot:s1570_g3.t1